MTRPMIAEHNLYCSKLLKVASDVCESVRLNRTVAGISVGALVGATGAGVVGAFVAPRTVGTVDGTAEGFRVGANDK